MGSVPMLFQGSKYKPRPLVPIPPELPAGAPQFSSAEIGAVNAFTLPITFDQNISASNYATGVTIKVNGTATSITSATRQANHAIVRYVIPVLWHGSADVVTWEYNSATGNIVAESGGAALGNVTAQTVTNNVAWASLLDLQSDTLSALNDGDPISTWANQIPGGGHNFTQTGGARPTKQTISSVPVVDIDGVTQWLDGGNFADNLPSFTFICGMHSYSYVGGENILVKETDAATSGYELYTGFSYIYRTPDFTSITDNLSLPQNIGFIETLEITSINPIAADLYFNKNSVSPDVVQANVTDYSTTGTVKIGYYHDAHLSLYCTMILVPAPNSTDRRALEDAITARYGIVRGAHVASSVRDIGASAVVITFDEGVSAPGNDYTTGVTINVNGLPAVISSATRQSNHAVINYVVAGLLLTDAITYAYSSAAGVIVSEAASIPLEDVATRTVL